MKKGVIFLLRVYQATISPFVGHCCRFFPTCSEYAVEAVETHGIFKGVGMALKRILKCHPFHPGGSDPV